MTPVSLVAMLLLAGCGYQVQATSGADYLAARPEFKPPVGGSVERTVYDAANTEPALRFPARIGLARLGAAGYGGPQLTAIPPEEADLWLALASKAGPSCGEFVPISPLITEMATGSREFSAIDKIRIGAARQHVDAVLIYAVGESTKDRATPLSVADLTVLGAFLIPSRAIEGQAVANAILLDVRNGYPYGTATSTAQQTGFTVNAGSGDRARGLANQAAVEAVGKLADNVGVMMARLKSELDTRELTRLRAAQPPAATPVRRARTTRG